MESTLSGKTSTGVGFNLRLGRQGEPVVWLHGQFGDRTVWQDVAARLSVRRPSAFIDLPGHGTSPLTPGAGLGGLALSVVDVMNALGWSRCTVVAHSLGCMAAVGAVASSSTRFSRLVLVGCPPVPTEADRGLLRQLEQHIRTHGCDQGLAQMLAGLWYSPGYASKTDDLAARTLSMLSKNDRHAAADICAGLAATPSGPVGALPVRTTAVVMKEDRVCGLTAAGPVLQALNAKTVELPGGHFPMHECPDDVVSVLNAELAD